MPRPLATLIGLLAGVCLLAPPPARAAGPLGADAVWAWWWKTPDALLRSVVDDGFSRVYLYCEGGFTPKVRKAIAALGSEGIAVEALGGESRWATTDLAGLMRFVRSAVRYQRSAPASARLAGIHLDIEPYELPSWHRDPDAVGRSLVAALRRARRAAGDLPLVADIPFWFDQIHPREGGPSLAESVMRQTAATTIMAYRDAGDAILAVAQGEVRIAARLGRPATIGVETGRVAPERVTFFEEGRSALGEALGEVRSSLGANPGFGGIAVHHLGSLESLRP